MISFFEGILLGYGLVVPVGPINVLIVSYAIKSLRLAICFGFGALSADFVYFMLMNLGILAFAQNETFIRYLAFFGAFILIFMAVLILKGAKKDVEIKPINGTKDGFKTYLKGISLGFANPYAITFWLSIATISATSDNILLLILGFFLSASSWLIFLPFVINKIRNIINKRAIMVFSYFSFIVLLLFAFKLLYKAFE